MAAPRQEMKPFPSTKPQPGARYQTVHRNGQVYQEIREHRDVDFEDEFIRFSQSVGCFFIGALVGALIGGATDLIVLGFDAMVVRDIPGRFYALVPLLLTGLGCPVGYITGTFIEFDKQPHWPYFAYSAVWWAFVLTIGLIAATYLIPINW